MSNKEILAELKKREPIFHHPEYGTDRNAFESMTVNDYWEVGASGSVYSRDLVIDTLIERYADPDYAAQDKWETSDFACRHLGNNTYLLTYRLIHKNRQTRRVTIWRLDGDDWKIVYHQGTVVTKRLV